MLRPKEWVYPDSKVTRIIDADSAVYEMGVDIGFHGTVTFVQKMRLNRINAPKISSEAGLAARNYFTSLVQNSSLTLVTFKPYKYGDEWMVEVYIPDRNGLNVSDELVKQGMAVYWDGNGPRPSDG